MNSLCAASFMLSSTGVVHGVTLWLPGLSGEGATSPFRRFSLFAIRHTFGGQFCSIHTMAASGTRKK